MEVSVPPGSVCCFCLTTYDEEALYGKIYKIEEITTHYFCLLLSSKVQQRGTDEEGILGFLATDIRNEVRRGQHLCCAYCGKRGATISCYSAKCKLHFHLPCGRERDTFHQFFGEFKSFCCKHRRTQKIKKEVLNAMCGKQSTCYICLESVPATPSPRTLWAPCCSKEAWFHRLCVQRLALSAGYFFKCPLCNNTTQFVAAMRTCGIWIPEQDASWERDPERYEGLLQRHNSCDAKSCRCRQGRTFHLENTKWEIKLCADCGSQGMHVQCGNLRVTQDWVCSVCAAVASKDKSRRSRKILQTREALMDRNRARRSLPSRPLRRVTRQSGPCSPEDEAEQEVVKSVTKTTKTTDLTPSADKETPSDPPRETSAQTTAPLPSSKEALPENSQMIPEHANSDVEIIDVTENSDDEIQHWRSKKNTPLTCLCKGNKRPYWSRNVHHAVGSSLSSCCFNRRKKYIYHGKSSGASIKNSDNELISRFFSSLTSCPGTTLEKGEPFCTHLWIIHRLDCLTDHQHLSPRKLGEPRGFMTCDDASSTIAPESSSRTRGRKRTSVSCEGTKKKQEPKKSQTHLEYLPNNAPKASAGAEVNAEHSKASYYLRRSNSRSRGRSATPHGRSSASSKEVVNSARSGCKEREESRSSGCNKRGKRKRSSSEAGNAQRKRNSDSTKYPENRRATRSTARRCSTGSQPPSSRNCTNLKVGDGVELAQLSEFQPVVVLERYMHISRWARSESIRRARSESVERVSDKLKCASAGRSRRDQFTSRQQPQSSSSSNSQASMSSSSKASPKRNRSRTPKNMIVRSPVRTRSRSRSLSQCAVSLNFLGNTTTSSVATVCNVPENLDLPYNSSYLSGETLNESYVQSKPKSPSVASSDDITWGVEVEPDSFSTTMESISLLQLPCEVKNIEAGGSSSSDDSSSISSFKQYLPRPPTPPHRSSPDIILPPVTDPCSPISFDSEPEAQPMLNADAIEVPASTMEVSSDSHQSSSSPLVMPQPSSTEPIESGVASTATTALSAIELVDSDIPCTLSSIELVDSDIPCTSSATISAEPVVTSVETLVNVPSPRRSPRSLPFVPTYNHRVTKRTILYTNSTMSVRRSSPPPIFPRRSGSPTEMECRMKARALTARKFLPMSRVATEQRAKLRRMQVSHEKL